MGLFLTSPEYSLHLWHISQIKQKFILEVLEVCFQFVSSNILCRKTFVIKKIKGKNKRSNYFKDISWNMSQEFKHFQKRLRKCFYPLSGNSSPLTSDLCLRPRLRCPSHPAAAMALPASPPPTAPPSASPGSRHPSPSPGTWWGKTPSHSARAFYTSVLTVSNVCPLQVSPSKSQGFGEQRSQTIAALSSPPRATTALRFTTTLTFLY